MAHFRSLSARIGAAISLCCIVACLPIAYAADAADPPAAGSLATGAYRVYVGAFRSEASARELCDALAEQRQAVAVAEDSTNGTHLFICRSERTFGRSEAQDMADRLRSENGQEAIIVPVPASSTRKHASISTEPRSAVLTPELRQKFEQFMQQR